MRTCDTLNHLGITSPCILLCATIARSIESESDVFVDLRCNVHAGVDTVVVNVLCHTFLAEIAKIHIVCSLVVTAAEREVVLMLKTATGKSLLIPIGTCKFACAILLNSLVRERLLCARVVVEVSLVVEVSIAVSINEVKLGKK